MTSEMLKKVTNGRVGEKVQEQLVG